MVIFIDFLGVSAENALGLQKKGSKNPQNYRKSAKNALGLQKIAKKGVKKPQNYWTLLKTP